MTGIIGVIVCLVSIGAGIKALRIYVRYLAKDLERQRRREFWWNEFLERTRPLLADPDTPLSVLEAVEAFSMGMCEPGAPRLLYKSMLKTSALPREEGNFAKLKNRRPELAEAYGKAMISGFLAMSYQDSKWGPRLRALAMDTGHRARDEASYIAAQVKDLPKSSRAHRIDLQPA